MANHTRGRGINGPGHNHLDDPRTEALFPHAQNVERGKQFFRAALALLVLPIIQRPIWALAYLLVFGLGTIAGMMLMTAAIAVPITYTARFDFFQRHLGTVAGVLSLGFGLFLAYQIGFVDGLFTH